MSANDIAFSVVIKNDGISDIIFKTIMLKGDKGNSVSRVEKTSTSGLVDTYTIYLTDGTAGGTFTVTNGNDINIDDTAVSYSKTWSSQKIKSELDDLSSDLSDAVDALSGMIPQTDTIEDVAIASFSDGADDLPVSELIVDIEPFQAGSGTPSPDNVRAISGWSECNITKAGKNLFSYDLPLYNGYWLTDGFHGDGNQVSYENAMNWCFYPIKVKEGESITISNSQAMSGVYSAFYKDNPSNIISTFLNWSANGTKQVPQGANYLGFIINRGGTGTVNPKSDFPNAQIEVGNQATEYEAFKETDTATIDFDGNTVYGGNLDVTNGVLNVTHEYKIFRGANDENWLGTGTVGSNYRYYIENVGNIKSTNSAISNYLMPFDDFSHEFGTFRFATNQTLIVHDKDAQFADVSAFKAYLSSNNLEIVYELAEPVEIQLTPVEVMTLLKNNNIYADTGNINKLVYFKTGSEAVARLIEAYMRGNSEPEE